METPVELGFFRANDIAGNRLARYVQENGRKEAWRSGVTCPLFLEHPCHPASHGPPFGADVVQSSPSPLNGSDTTGDIERKSN
jgi:hypothetical protein